MSWYNSRICNCLLFHERGKQNFVQPFLRLMKLLRLHTRFNTEVMSWISRAYECQLCMDLLEYSVWFVYCLWAACHCLSWSAVAMRALTWVVFVPRASFTSTLRSGSSPSPMRQRAGPIACTKLPVDVQSSWNIYMRSFKIYGIWPQTDRHKYMQLPQIQSR